MNVESRNLFGKRNNQLRRSGKVTGCIYGHKISTIPIQVELKELVKYYEKYGMSSFFEVKLGENRYSVVFKNIDFDPVSGKPINFDLFNADQKSKANFEVPVVLVGESPAVKSGMGILLCNYEKLNVYCLPKDLPISIQVDLTSMIAADSVMLLSDIQLPNGVVLDSSYDFSSTFLQIVSAQKNDLIDDKEQPDGHNTDNGKTN